MKKIFSRESLLTWWKLAFIFIWPFLSFYSHNIRQPLSITTLSSIFAIGVVILLTITLPVAVFKNSETLRKWTDILAVSIFFIFSYALSKKIGALLSIPNSSIAILWFFMFICILLVTLKLIKNQFFSEFLFVIGLALIALPLIQTFHHHSTKEDDLATQNKISTQPVHFKPNIYYFVLDGYARQDILKSQFNYSNDDFIKSLKERKFFVAEKSLTNFPITHLSISTSLQMDFITNSAQKKSISPADVSHIFQGDNHLVKYLKNAGYTYLRYGNKMWGMGECGPDADICINDEIKSKKIEFHLNNTATNFLMLTPAYGIIFRIFDFFSSDEQLTGLGKIMYFLKNFQSNKNQNTFLFAHVLAPHPPPQYDEDCKYTLEKINMVKWNKSEFLSQIPCVNADIIKIIDLILTKDKSNPIIVLQSDHGPSIRNQFLKPFTQWNKDDFLERYAILVAALIPEHCKTYAYNTISPVNIFRLVLGCMQNTQPTFLDDDLFYATYEGQDEYGKIFEIDKRAYETK